MDWNFNIDNFERLLKEKSDEFRMYPSNRVWHSIYNNFHPGRKWPSVVMCITLISTLLLVGYLNTNITSENNVIRNPVAVKAKEPISVNSNSNNIVTAFIPYKANTNASIANTEVPANSITEPTLPGIKKSNTNNPIAHNNFDNGSALSNISSVSVNNIAIKQSSDLISTASPSVKQSDFINTSRIIASTDDKINTQLASENNSSAENAVTNPKIYSDNRFPLTSEVVPGISNTNNLIASNDNAALPGNERFNEQVKQIILADNKTQIDIADSKNNTESEFKLSGEQKGWIEDYALHNRPVPYKWKGKLAWQGYVTPSVVYRNLFYNEMVQNSRTIQAGFASTVSNADVNNELTHKPSYGFEIGGGLQYDLFKRIKIRSGLQVNYTRYNIMAFENTHPSSTSLTMINPMSELPYLIFRSTPYSNITGFTPTKLHNQTLQVSIPVGIDVKLAEIDNLEWYVGSSIQPTLLVGGSLYLISSDRRNYVSDRSMFNRLNMNAAFETYITYKTNSGFTWQFGPQYRTQLFSNYNKLFSLGEKLVNYGFKVGISKKL